MPLLVIPITLASLIKCIHFAKETRKLREYLPFLVMQLNTLFVWTCSGVFWVYHIKSNATFIEWFTWLLVQNAFQIDTVGIFIYTWSFLDVVISNMDGKWKTVLVVYKFATIFAFPIITYAFYFVQSYVWARVQFQYEQTQDFKQERAVI